MPNLNMFLLPFVVFSISTSVQADEEARELKGNILAHFRFDGDARDDSGHKTQFQLKNTQFKENALFLNGKYEHFGDENANRAVCVTPDLDYDSFTVAIRFKAASFERNSRGEVLNQRMILAGGTSYRWFAMLPRKNGNLTITLNNFRYGHELEHATVHKNKWTVVVCSVSLPDRKIVVYLNGKKSPDIQLPEGFSLDVATSDGKERDKVWTFSSYADGRTFHGLVDELIIYDRFLSSDEIGSIPLRP